MQAGRWRDPNTATGYTEAELAGRGPVARLFYGRRQGRPSGKNSGGQIWQISPP